MFVFLLYTFVIILCVLCSCIVCKFFSFCILLFPSYFFTILPTAALGGSPIALKEYNKITYLFPLQENNFYIFKFMLSLPITELGTGLKDRQLVLYFFFCVCVCVCVYTHTHIIYNKFQFTFPLALLLCAEGHKFESEWRKSFIVCKL